MSKLELSKESLLFLAKKLGNKNFSRPLFNVSKEKQKQSDSLILNSKEKEDIKSLTKEISMNNFIKNKINTKKPIRYKNKFLEKNNIHINEEKMRNILIEKKRKMKFALSQRNNKIGNKLLGKDLKIDIDKENNNYKKEKSNIINEGSNNYNSYITSVENNGLDKYHNNTYYNSFNDIQLKSNNNKEINIYNIEPKKRIFNSNSDYFEKHNINRKFISSKNSLKKNNINNINIYSRNKNFINNNSQRKLYSIKNNKDYNNSDVKDDINIKENIEDENKINNNINNSINNNININININNNNDNKRVNNISNTKSLRNSPNNLKRKRSSYNYISFNDNIKPEINNNIIKELRTYNNIKGNNINGRNNQDKQKEILIPSSEKKSRRFISYNKSFNNSKIKDNNNKMKINEYEEIEEEEEEINDNDIDNEIKEKNQKVDNKNINNKEKYNIYNINLNFISDKRNDSKGVEYYNTDENTFNSKLNNLKYKSHGKHRLYSIEIPNKIKKNNIYKYRINKNNSMNKIINNNSISEMEYDGDGDYDYNNTMNAPITIKPMNIINNKKDIIQLEDLLILEGKLCHLLNCLKNDSIIPKMCIEWWSFYTYSSFYGKFSKLFPKIKNENEISDYEIAHDAIILELLSIIVLYEILNDIQINKNIINILINLINEIHQNFLIECDYILSKVNVQSLNNLWINKLKNLILSKKKWEKEDIIHMNYIKEGNDIIQNYIDDIINTYDNYDSNNIDISSLIYYNQNVSKIHLIELNRYFNKVINKENAKIDRTLSYIIKTKLNSNKNENSIKNVIIPYLPKIMQGNKNYTLVLDLDETLISFRFNRKNEGILKTRPGLYNFLNSVGNKYEMVIFTAGTQEYADPIIDIIEKGKKIFIKRLYRQHTVFIDNIFAKDLTRLGRDLSKIIIVDNMPQNFFMQKENGIFIKNFFGQDDDDRALIDLSSILLNIASKPNNDVRKELKKYREEIFTKITTNLK